MSGDPFEEKRSKRLTPMQAKVRAEKYCAYQERCQQEVRDKLYEWGLHKDDVENLIANLITDNFLNEERFAIAFAGGKFRIKHWGRNKIRAELKKRKISEYCIKRALQGIDEDDYRRILSQLLGKKMNENKKGKLYMRQYKVSSYAISRGFESDLVRELLKHEDFPA